MKLKTLVAGVALAVASAGSFAHSALTFDFAPDGTKTASLAGSHLASATPWTDIFFFDLLQPGVINGSAISIKLGKSDWDFTSITLSNGTSSWAFTQTAGSNDALEIYTLPDTVIGSGSYTLTVVGTVTGGATSGSYGGNINIAPVPEPETYALMLAGLGAVGLLISRRRNQA